ncbi:MAG: CHAT domain-containing protein [Synechococcales cyanobacterium RM1_1_8]|nr:CHAT domain-containing protein [Synechococcales cyanobacterium RM1_1_8]
MLQLIDVKSSHAEAALVPPEITAQLIPAYSACKLEPSPFGIRSNTKGNASSHWLPSQTHTQPQLEIQLRLLLQQGWELSHNAEFESALPCLEAALKLYQAIDHPIGQGQSLFNIAWIYYSTADYEKAIATYQQAITIHSRIRYRGQWGETYSLGGLGLVYSALGDHSQAITYAQRTLSIAKEEGDRLAEGYSYVDLGDYHYALGNIQQALAFYDQAIATGVQHHEAYPYLGAGNAHQALGDYQQAITKFQQALAIADNDYPRIRALAGLGKTHQAKDKFEIAQAYYLQALGMAERIGDRQGEAVVLSHLGSLLAAQDQPELATVFYKSSVQRREAIRQGIQGLSSQLRQQYVESVSTDYRVLADLLLSQGRVLEAQQVLELLKIQELRDYTKDTRAGGQTNGAPLTPPEAAIVPPHNQLISLGAKLTACESQKPYCPERQQLQTDRKAALATFNQKAEDLRLAFRSETTTDPALLEQGELTRAAQKLIQAHPNSVLIYPLVLEDKLWLVWGAQAGQQGVIFDSKEIPVSRKELSTTVAQFRTLLEQRGDEAELQRTGQQLYNWLIAPIRPELEANGVDRLIFSLDRATRYIPMAALHDGEQYLVENFTTSTILTADGTDTTDRLAPAIADNPVLGLGLTQAVPGFNALPNVASEVNGIVRRDSPDDSAGIFPGDEKFDQAFDQSAFDDLIDYRILHIATHGQFVSGNPDDSFLLLGNGERLKIPEIQTMADLGGIHLAVLSACETAKGGIDKEGIEVSGLSYYFLTQGVKSVAASLWLVNDASTSELMQRFYANLAAGQSKAEALRQAQLSLMEAEQPAGQDADRASVAVVSSNGITRAAATGSFSHPYYWAPFILIGNGL